MERKLWAQLKLLDINGHFRRQAPVGPYFADFAHHHGRLIVELDGSQHGQASGQVRDARRTAYLEAEGYRVLRFWNNDVHENLDGVIETIFAALNETPPTPSPSPPQAGGGECALPDGGVS
jgi:very-short-patch-repair endonuclease